MKKKTTKISIAIVLALIVLLAIFFYPRLHDHIFGNNSVTTQNKKTVYKPPTPAQKKANEQNKIKNTSDEKDSPTISSTASGQIEISSLAQDTSTKDVIVQTKLFDVTWKQCTLTLSMSGYSDIVKTASVLFSPDFSTCEGFSIPPSDFPITGTWSVVLSAQQSNGATQSTAPQTINVVR